MTTRTRGYRLDVLAKAPDPDVVVIGGGINGISVYRELALQGLRGVQPPAGIPSGTWALCRGCVGRTPPLVSYTIGPQNDLR